jgi:hypothetical protein
MLVPILSTDTSAKPLSSARYDADMPADPAEVWKLVQRADELVKYAQNRDPALAYAQARGVLDQAEALAAQVEGPAADGLRAQIRTRREDIARFEGGS